MRRAQRRGTLEQRRDGLPGEALIGELVGFRRHPEAVAGMQLDAAGVASERVLRLAAIGVDIDPREPLAGELVGHDLAGGVEAEAGAMDRGGALRVPPRS